jgi:hypothetical protein
MCIVIMFDLYYLSKNQWMLAAAIILTVIVGFSRIYARSRFPHQIVGSAITGTVGLQLAYIYCTKMDFEHMPSHNHGVYVALGVAAVVCYFSMAIESNDSRLMYIPKQEFIRVLRGIAFPEDQQQQAEQQQSRQWHHEAQEGSPRSPKSPMQRINTPRSLAIKQAIANASRLSANARMRGNTKAANKDSFYFLQRTLEKREEEKNEFARQMQLANANTFGDALNDSFFRRRSRAADVVEISSSDSEYISGGKAT